MMKTGLREKVGAGVAAALMMAAVGVASAPPAAAAPADCPKEYVCVWNNHTASGKPKWKSKGNLYDLHSATGLTIVNNGVRHPGADHIWYNLTATPENGGNFKGCLHYPNDTNQVSWEGPVTLHSARWGREC